MANSSMSTGRPARAKEVKNGAGPLAGASAPPPLEGAGRAGQSAASAAKPTVDDIARKAYEIYEREGRQPGRDLENWLQAEIELGLRPGSH
jgi:hypothetical protein